MTALYSNAVLVAALPYVSDFSTKLNLPITLPVTTGDVARAGIAPYKEHADTGIWLTNGYWFSVNYSGAFVQSFRAPTNFFYEQSENIKKYAGEDHMTTNEAVAMARAALGKLGYDSKESHSLEIPDLEPPCDTPQGHMPYCRVKWHWPKGGNFPAGLTHYINIDINTETKTIVGMELFFNGTNLLPTGPLRVNVEPELEKDFRRMHPRIFLNSNAPPKSLPEDR